MQHVTSTENIQGYVLRPIVDAGWCELALSLRTTARSLPLHTTDTKSCEPSSWSWGTLGLQLWPVCVSRTFCDHVVRFALGRT